MEIDDGCLGMIVAAIIIATFAFFIGLAQGYKDGYKEGQVDAIKGKIVYQQKAEAEWERKRTEIK